MTGAFVLDASVTLAWLRQSDATPVSQRAQDALADNGVAFVPTLWRYEIANVLIREERLGQLAPEHVGGFLEELEALAIYEEDAWPSAVSLVARGRVHQLSAYDAAYLIIAQRLALPLATDDRALREAAREADLELL